MNDIANVRIERIVIGDRHRKSLGRIEELAGSIAQLGLLQPVGIDPSRRLIFGARRIKAFEHLGRKTIPARVIAIDDLLDGEHAENLIRKDFTVSERVAIGKSMAARMGERRGNPTGANQYGEGKPQNSAEYQTEETRDLAAEKSGLGSHFTYQQAEKVCDQGIPELVTLMDDEAISIDAAARLADYPEEMQRRAAEKIAAGAKPTEALRQIKSEEILREVSAPTAKYRILYADPPWGRAGITKNRRTRYERFTFHFMTPGSTRRCSWISGKSLCYE